MKFAVIVFPGSNCDADMLWAIRDIVGVEAEYVRYDETSLYKAMTAYCSLVVFLMAITYAVELLRVFQLS